MIQYTDLRNKLKRLRLPNVARQSVSFRFFGDGVARFVRLLYNVSILN